MNREYKRPEILYKLLSEHNMTQQQRADKLVCGQNTIYKWLRKDIMPNLCFIMLMSEIFNVSIDYLVYGEDTDGQTVFMIQYKQKGGISMQKWGIDISKHQKALDFDAAQRMKSLTAIGVLVRIEKTGLLLQDMTITRCRNV